MVRKYIPLDNVIVKWRNLLQPYKFDTMHGHTLKEV
jgi:hypothetical protein